jgi:hypothetical protein
LIDEDHSARSIWHLENLENSGQTKMTLRRTQGELRENSGRTQRELRERTQDRKV